MSNYKGRLFAAAIAAALHAAPVIAGEASIPQIQGVLGHREDIKLLTGGLADLSRAAANLPNGVSAAQVTQQGANNQATIMQTGVGNYAAVQQVGQGNSAVVIQRR